MNTILWTKLLWWRKAFWMRKKCISDVSDAEEEVDEMCLYESDRDD